MFLVIAAAVITSCAQPNSPCITLEVQRAWNICTDHYGATVLTSNPPQPTFDPGWEKCSVIYARIRRYQAAVEAAETTKARAKEDDSKAFVNRVAAGLPPSQ